MDSYQAHLQRISPFLLLGPGVWWSNNEGGYKFHDGDNCSSSSPTELQLLHCRENNVHQVLARQDETWKYIIENKIELPISALKLYTDEGDYITTCTYVDTSDQEDTENEMCEATITTILSGDGDTFATPSIATTLCANTSTTADTTKERVTADCTLSVTDLEEPSSLPQHQQLPATVSQSSLLHVSELKTKLCRAIEKCTGLTDKLKKLDELRHKLKTEKHQQQHLCADEIVQYEQLVANMKLTIIRFKREVQTSLNVIEKKFYSEHGHVPTTEQDSPVWFQQSKRLHYIYKLLNIWKSETV